MTLSRSGPHAGRCSSERGNGGHGELPGVEIRHDHGQLDGCLGKGEARLLGQFAPGAVVVGSMGKADVVKLG